MENASNKIAQNYCKNSLNIIFFVSKMFNKNNYKNKNIERKYIVKHAK